MGSALMVYGLAGALMVKGIGRGRFGGPYAVRDCKPALDKGL